jgi:transaldolase
LRKQDWISNDYGWQISNERGSSSGDPSSSRPRSKILVDGGDPAETLRVKQSLGFVDGQTTNPSLIAKNPK